MKLQDVHPIYAEYAAKLKIDCEDLSVLMAAAMGDLQMNIKTVWSLVRWSIDDGILTPENIVEKIKECRRRGYEPIEITADSPS